MSVASTKAFYAQVAAGALLACAITEAIGCGSDQERHALLAGAAGAARRAAHGPDPAAGDRRRGPPAGSVAPLLGGGRQRPQLGGRRGDPDQAERALLQVDRLRRHRGQEAHRPVLRAADPRVRGRPDRFDGGRRGQGGGDLPGPQGGARRHRHRGRGALPAPRPRSSPSPGSQPELAFVLAAMVGHLFGYEAALAIDALARPAAGGPGGHRAGGRHGRARGRRAAAAGCGRTWRRSSQRFVDGLRSGAYDGNLEASTAVGLVGRLRDITGDAPLESYQRESGRVATPAGLVDDLTAALSRGIDELTRPVDAIKHQAKTVTVGISRSRRGPAGPPARAGGPGRRRAAGAAQLHARCGRSPRSTRRSPRWSASPATRSRATPPRARPRSRSSTGEGSRSACRRGSSATRTCRARSAGSPWSASCSSPGAVTTAGPC